MIRHLKNLRENNDGFLSIIALAIFAIMMIVGINLQMQSMDTMNRIRESINHSDAEAIAESALEYLQWKMKNYEEGMNDEVTCKFSNGAADGGNSKVCGDSKLFTVVGTRNVSVDIKVSGRSTQRLNSAKCGKGFPTNAGCYMTPIPGTGDAGDQQTYCKMYKPSYVGDTNTSSIISDNLSNNSNPALDQINYSCNWNKLSHGSSQTDRVAVPLYYDKSLLVDTAGQAINTNDTIVNPFHEDTLPTEKAKKFVVKLRTPCKPCAKNGVAVNGINEDYLRTCGEADRDETVCKDTDRYELDASTSKKDDIVVQWLINGECDAGEGKTEACGIVPIPDVKIESALYESLIFKNNSPTYNFTKDNAILNFQVIDGYTLAYDSSDYSSNEPPKIALLNSSKENVLLKLPTMSKPVFSLFLSKPLLTYKKHNIPHLEYQIIADQPIGNSKRSLEASAVVNESAYKKTLTKAVKVPLINFAIHN